MKENNRYELAEGYSMRMFAKNYTEYTVLLTNYAGHIVKEYTSRSLLKSKKIAIEYIKSLRGTK